MRLAGKTAIVTGSGRGIGRAVALKLACEGANVVVNDLDGDAAAAVRAEVEALGAGRAAIAAGDVTDRGFPGVAVEAALALGGLDIVVNNAGYTWDSVIHKMTEEQFCAILDVHLGASFRLLRAAAAPMRAAAKADAEAGREVFRKIVNISSIAGLSGNAGQSNYAAAKAGVIGLTRALAKEWGPLKINVNAVAFGVVETRLTQVFSDQRGSIDVAGRTIPVGISEQTYGAFAQAIPLGRPGSVQDAAGGVFLMCSPDSNYITGQVLVVGGGLRI